jgi:hypothetical protein
VSTVSTVSYYIVNIYSYLSDVREAYVRIRVIRTRIGKTVSLLHRVHLLKRQVCNARTVY